ncbi:MAG: tetratricopeptide repeat protein [Planctomycetales bacterium]
MSHLSASDETPPASKPAPPRVKLSRTRKALFSLVACGLFFAGLEGVLWLCGVAPLFATADPYVGFHRTVPLFVREGAEYRTNPVKRQYFNDQSFPVVKAPGAYRIFTLGGSTTFGHPYKDGTSFTGWLRELLHDIEPERDWQVVNCGGVSYASYRECVLMQELILYQPDLFIICTGHNEFLEERTYGELRQRSAPRRALEAIVWQTRVGSLAARCLGRGAPAPAAEKRLPEEVDTILEHSIGPTSYHRDRVWREGVARHFAYSLDRLCLLAQGTGARVILITPAANLRDFSPFKSERGDVGFSRIQEADERLLAARRARDAGDAAAAADLFLKGVSLDPEYAQGQFEAGRALLEVHRADDAWECFQRAADEDICPLRASRELQREVSRAARRHGVELVDFPELLGTELEQAVGHHIPGDESFLDHVHPTIEVHRRLAWSLVDRLSQWGLVGLPSDRDGVTQRISDKVLSQIDSRGHALALVQVIQVLSWAGKNQEALRLTETAENTHPGLSQVASYRGRLLDKLGRRDEAYAALQEAVRRDEHDSLALSRLGFAELERHDWETARDHFQQAIEFTPLSAPVSFRTTLHVGLGQALLELDRLPTAIIHFQAALDLSPDSKEARQGLQRANARSRKGGFVP